MTTLRCTICYREVKAFLSDLHTHCDAYHYAQSPDLIFPNHGLHYHPMNALLKRELVARGEQKMRTALLGSPTIAPEAPPVAYVVIKPAIEIQYSHTSKSVLESKPEPKQMRVVYLSDAWEQLVCQSWVTVKVEAQANGDDIAVMEKF